MTLPIVLHLAYGLDYGGVESHLRLIGAQGRDRYDHRFAAIKAGGAVEAALVAAGAQVDRLDIDPYEHPLRACVKLYQLFRDIKPSVVHAHGAEANLFGLPLAAAARIPVRIGEEIGMPSHGRRARIAYGLAYRASHRVIGVADAVRDWLVESGEVPAEKALRIYNPVELPTTALATARKEGEPIRIGFTGRLVTVKNPIAIVEAVALVRAAGVNAELVLIGDGHQRSVIEARAATLGIRSKVQFAGFVNNPKLLLAGCHLYVQPSLSEGFGIALVEAMGCGLPVIASSEGGMPEIVQHGCTGWLLPSPAATDIASAISFAADLRPDRLAAIGLAARRSVEERFNPSIYYNTIETLYETLLGSRQ